MSNVVKAEEFQLVDQAGRIRSKIYISDEGKVVADIFDSAGRLANRIDLHKIQKTGPAPHRNALQNKKETLGEWHSRIASEVQVSPSKLHVGSYKLYIDFVENNTRASAKYLNEVIEISGEIVDVSTKHFGDLHIGLKGISNYTAEVICHFAENLTPEVSNLKPGLKVRLKGKCTEYVNKRVKIWGCQIL
ncbi:OB-fold protein [Maridesulfovibrio hydrothermalis]|uniref:Uncharacterized protein n=1 Tax=Maridesulfovibrio hydrothermalis AM13 = DSM 14728 TaxID=1121451 RepID=L0R9C7_9BACT|nr:hypothetical protein [Maridesulfovibrio hydrothermalis]CCO22795.1 conserved protein of unknown function [Maridesulfovibrio hydrothermalis AM13 = DSM 14728]